MLPAPPVIDAMRSALFLDVDGTLLAIEEHPRDVSADPPLLALLEELLAHFDGAMALISGRSLAEIDRIFGGTAFPAIGAHGAEQRTGEAPATSAPAPALPEAIVDGLQRFADDNEGLLLEHKRGGVSLHFRRAPELEAACRAAVNAAMDEAGEDFRLIEGKMVFEIAPRQHNKGAAIQALLATPAFADRRPVFVGDDVTDEDGFAVVNDLEGVSIRVGDSVSTAARFRLDDVAVVRRWLASIAAASRESNDNK